MSSPSANAIVDVLGLAASSDPAQFLTVHVAEGFQSRVLDRVQRQIAPGDKAFWTTVIPKATLDRQKKRGRLSAQNSDRVYDIARVWAATLEVFKDKDAARQFVHRPHMLLNNQSPIDVAMISSAGADQVVTLINRAAAGVAL